MEWSPPEQFDGVYEQRSDVWGLGLVMYHLVEMEMPFAGVSKNVLPYAIQGGRLEFDAVDKTDPIFKEQIKMCLHVDRKKRPKASQLAERLEKLAPRISSLQFLKLLGLDDDGDAVEEIKQKAKREKQALEEEKKKLEKAKRKTEQKAAARIRDLETKLAQFSNEKQKKEENVKNDDKKPTLSQNQAADKCELR